MATHTSTITAVPLFQQLDPKLREVLADIVSDIGTERTLQAGEILYEKDAEDPITGAVLIDGALEASADGEKAVEVDAPELVGEMQQFDPYGRRTATVRAKESVTIIEFAWHDFVARVLEHPEIDGDAQLSIKHAFEKYVGDRLGDGS